MTLIRLKPKGPIRAKAAAAILGVSSKKVKELAFEGHFAYFRMSDGRTSPIMVFESQILEFLEKRVKKRRV